MSATPSATTDVLHGLLGKHVEILMSDGTLKGVFVSMTGPWLVLDERPPPSSDPHPPRRPGFFERIFVQSITGDERPDPRIRGETLVRIDRIECIVEVRA